MTIIQVSNTKQIPGREFVGVQADTDVQAEAALEVIAKRHGVTFEIAYRWGPTPSYYYAPMQAAAQDAHA